jgi:hypothetical protein
MLLVLIDELKFIKNKKNMTKQKAVSKVKSINRKGHKEITQRTQRFVSQCFDFAPFAITSCTLRLKRLLRQPHYFV